MKFLIALSLLISSFAFAAPPSGGVSPSVTVGGVVMPTGGLIMLDAMAQPNYSALRKGGGTAGYQVTAGKTLTIKAIEVNCWTVAATNTISFSYADNDIGINQVGPPTNNISFSGSSNASQLFGTTAIGIQQMALIWPIPAGKFVTIQGAVGSVCNVRAWGYEQ